MNAPYVLAIRFNNGLQPQEIRFCHRPEVSVQNIRGWCWVFVNGKSYVKFHAEMAA